MYNYFESDNDQKFRVFHVVINTLIFIFPVIVVGVLVNNFFIGLGLSVLLWAVIWIISAISLLIATPVINYLLAGDTEDGIETDLCMNWILVVNRKIAEKLFSKLHKE